MEEFVKLGIMSLIATSIGIFFGYKSGYTSGQKQGQIDCLNGKIYYHKVVQQDSSVTWEYVKK